MKILVTDDKMEDRYLLETVLRGSGYEVVSVRNGVEALEILQKDTIGMIIADILMPEMDGFQLCRECKKDKDLRKIPFVFYTAVYTDRLDEEFAGKVGAEKYIVKPKEPQVLLNILKDTLKEQENRVPEGHEETVLEEDVYLAAYNKILVKKLEKKVVDLRSEIETRRQTENRLRESEEIFRNIGVTAQDAVIMVDNRGKTSYWNNAAERMFGYSSKEAVGKDLSDLVVPGTLREKFLKGFENFKDTGKGALIGKIVELTAVKKDGAEFPIEHSVSAIKIRGEWHAIGMIRDISGRKKMEEIILQSEKLKSLGVITAGIAHDFNNILAIISGSLQLIERGLQSEGELKGVINIISRAVGDGAEIVNRMQKFTQKGINHSEYWPVDLSEILEQAIQFSRPRWMNIATAGGVSYNIDQSGIRKTPPILGNPSELREVFLNIINNALDVMHEGGTLSFCTMYKEGNVYVVISDTGEGMTEEVRSRIFDPFYTTKRPEGSGLGMSVAYGIVTGLGGRIEVESEREKGTTITLRFPATENIVEQKMTTEENNMVTAGKLRILVIDDEVEVCRTLEMYLTGNGHEVKGVSDSNEAASLIMSEEFDLVLCDLVMPGLSGHDIIKVVSGLEKRPKIGMITGWGEYLEISEDQKACVDFILKKPFEFQQLGWHINNLFSEKSS